MTDRNADEFLFLPLGGAGEIGMNLNLYGYGPPGEHAWVMVDLGVTFSDGEVPGIDVIMPDPPMWNVLIVSCVPGSPMDCAAIMPTAVPSSTIRLWLKSRP